MSVQFIVGAGGTGKTTYIYNDMIKKSDNNQGDSIFYIIPEQSNMAAEQDMVSIHPKGGTMDISIMSFSRLAFMILEKDNIYTKDILDDYGKSMLIMKVLKQVENDLSYYKRMIGKNGFVDEVKSIISELYQYRITDDSLEKLMDNLSKEKSLYYKIKDIRLIKNAFEEAMGNTYMVAEQLLSLFADNISSSKRLQGIDIYFDGFTGFTPAQYEVIEELMKVCNDMYFSIALEADEMINNSDELFFMGREMMEHISDMAGRNAIKIMPRVSLYNNLRNVKNGELKFLERSLFRFPIREYTKYVDDISSDDIKISKPLSESNILDQIKIIEADDAYEEIVCIGRMMQYYVREKGFNYRDIAVITGDMGDRIHLWKQVMDRLEIPFFLDANEPLLHNPITEITVMLFELFDKDFSYDSVFALLKTGLIDMDDGNIFELENYILKTGIKGRKAWNRAFRRGAKDFDLEKMNKIREEFVSYIKEASEVFCKEKDKTSEYIRSLYFFAEHCHIQEYLFCLAKKFKEEGKLRQSKVYENAYEKYIMVLDKTMDILGDELIDRDALKDILIAGISDIQLGVIPSTLDQILIGDIERTRLHHKKILFIAGANEGILPGKAKNKGLINDKDRALLETENILLAPDSKREYYIRQYYLYMQLAEAEEQVIFSYRKKDDKGNGQNVALFIKWIRRMFPYISVEKAGTIIEQIIPSTVSDIISTFADHISEDEFDDSSFYKMIMSKDKKTLEKILSGYLYLNQPGKLNEEIAKRLYSSHINDKNHTYEMIKSVSQLETYAACPYKFFLQYGIRVKKRGEYRIESNHVGTILHEVMEEFFKKIDYKKMSEAERMDKVKEITVRKAYEADDTIFESSYRMKHQLNVLIRIAQRSVANLCRHLNNGDMNPKYFEKKFSPKDRIKYITMSLSDDITMGLNGIIDRVDIKETDDTVYVKIIDYKSSEKNIDYVKIVEGKQLQLAVYMSVVLELMEKIYPDKKIIPTGMFYYQLADRIAEGESLEEADDERVKKSRLTGLFNDDEECLKHMDDKTGNVVSVKYKKNGSISKNKYEVTTEELNAVSIYTRNKMIEIGENIICGQIDMSPQKGEHSSPCTYCDYKSICRFESGLGGNIYGVGSQLKFNEAKEIVCSNSAYDDKNKDNKSDDRQD